MYSDLTVFVWGITTCAATALAVAFGRSWRRSGDRFFAWFAVAFALLAVERVLALVLREASSEASSPAVFVLRLVAFVIIIVAIAEKNR